MRRFVTLLCSIVQLGCYGAIDDAQSPAAVDVAEASTTEAAPARPTAEPSSSEVQADGIPCAIAEALQQRCVACHSDPPRAGAPSSLLSRADLLADSITQPGRTMLAVAIDRMRDPNNPMPPAPAPVVAPGAVGAFETWLNDGAPAEVCGEVEVVDPYDTPTQCSTGQYWSEGDDGSREMLPGRPCVSCHDAENNAEGEIEAPPLWLGGTVYATAHEPDDCRGTGDQVTVEVIGADGNRVQLDVNASGNFLLEQPDASLVFPITAVVRYDGRERAMTTPADHGDCNACHTEAGQDGAPGRIMLP